MILKEIVKEVIISHAREEALEILDLATGMEIAEFVEYYEHDNFNSCCMHLDFIKHRLMKENVLEYYENDNFGDPEFYG